MKSKTILITGSTDGIGLETAKALIDGGHKVLLHGRNPEKLKTVRDNLGASPGQGQLASYVCDLSDLTAVEAFAASVAEDHGKIDVIINNAGVFKTNIRLSPQGLDVRFVVNTLAPYLLTKLLLPHMDETGRVVNLSSAAQSDLEAEELARPSEENDGFVYAQSKLAITMWTRSLARSLGNKGPMVVAVNPRSFLGSKMVMEAYGVKGGDLRVGADILCWAALSEEFADASGKYFDNDRGIFASPHPFAQDDGKCDEIVRIMDKVFLSL